MDTYCVVADYNGTFSAQCCFFMSNKDSSPETSTEVVRSHARSSLRPDSPCAGYCSTSHGDEVCKGCGRTWDEVLNWIIYTDEEKDAVWARLEAAGLLKVKR
ncbi:hypothetical protein GCM10008066_12400 [Oxalicibacterium faecigallinarum]|uniref:DUF1289 domain-containing protein n=2 Tax=Oxalicibacterium faecigallinarum TaxID=573741 RepID=A0A8J3AP66_9BURK|nr:hypothetical protein GCM10008066_12400 [Oxalicibacterium faecigallinarum]